MKPGDSIGDCYTAWELLDEGPLLERWLAWDSERWMPVWIRLTRSGLVDPASVEVLQREADHLRRLSHPAIPRFFDADLSHQTPHVVTEALDGVTVADTIAGEGRCDPVDCLYLGMELASVLRYLHRQDLSHGALSISTVFMRQGRAVVTGFEHVHHGGDQQADVRALAAVLIHALEGRPQASLSSPIPQDFAALIDRMLLADRDHNVLAASEVLAQLADLVPSDEEGLWPQWADPQADGGQRMSISPA